MSAVPKRKLCWNCEGNVARETDNCPYCGVYLQGTDEFEESLWNPPYSPANSTDSNQEVPRPLYQIHPVDSSDSSEAEEESAPTVETSSVTYVPTALLIQLKRDIFPTFFLMSGSVFFLFSVILFLFSHEGKLTLQWNGRYWVYFLTLSLPSLYYGWKCLQHLDE